MVQCSTLRSVSFVVGHKMTTNVLRFIDVNIRNISTIHSKHNAKQSRKINPVRSSFVFRAAIYSLSFAVSCENNCVYFVYFVCWVKFLGVKLFIHTFHVRLQCNAFI